MNRNRWILAMIAGGALAMLPGAAAAADEYEHGPVRDAQGNAGHRHEQGVSPLFEEMVKLDGVFRDVVSAVAVGDGARVQAALETMHGAMEKTHEGVHEGTVHLRKNADRMKEFVERDKAFHARLEALARAGQKNDQPAMLSLTKEVLDRCVGCHRDFR